MSASRRLRRALLPVLAGGLVASAAAAPVRSEDVAPDAFEVALQWTLASLTPQAPWTPATAVPALPVPAAPRPPAVLPAAAVPDPGAYALVGLLLVAAGLAAQRLTRRRGLPRGATGGATGGATRGAQRGLSKKT